MLSFLKEISDDIHEIKIRSERIFSATNNLRTVPDSLENANEILVTRCMSLSSKSFVMLLKHELFSSFLVVHLLHPFRRLCFKA